MSMGFANSGICDGKTYSSPKTVICRGKRGQESLSVAFDSAQLPCSAIYALDREALGGYGWNLIPPALLPHHVRRTPQEKAEPGHAGAGPIFNEPMGHIDRAARGILQDAALSHLYPYDMRSHAITRHTEIVGHAGDAMSGDIASSVWKRSAAPWMPCVERILICANSRLSGRSWPAKSRSSLRFELRRAYQTAVLAKSTAGRSEQTPTPHGQVPNIEHPSIQAEIDRRVALALAEPAAYLARLKSSSAKDLSGRRSSGSANRQQVGVMRPPSAPMWFLFLVPDAPKVML